ncbi:MAG: M6 family metalloprotease domain-containing protein [Bacteroidetes bacterium]|nr:M6 family metalloprotease domain-containing protein [Bacteroidota bacterium]
MKKLLFFIVFLYSVAIMASPFNGKIVPFKQADGSSVDVKLFGTEYYMRAEGLDGFTLIRDNSSNNIVYAKLSDDGTELLSTGIIYTGTKSNVITPVVVSQFAKHQDITSKARLAIIEKNKQALSGNEKGIFERNSKGSSGSNQTDGTPINPVSGNITGLCIVVDFSDEPGTLPMSEFEDFCNDLTYSNFSNNGSLRTYYSDISGGLVDYQNVVYGYYRAPLTFADYDAMGYAVGAQEILGLALEWIDSLGFDFSTLSTNPDNSIKAINLMYTGNPPVWAQGMWHHKGNYNGFSADGVHSNDYNCSPANSPLELAVVAHENGHMIGQWPDTYKYNSSTGPDGIGSFDLMCWYGNSFNPTPPNPLFKNNCGWNTMIDVTNYNGIINDTANSLTCYRYNNMNDTNEFYVLENRMMTDRSLYIDDEGLTIWHINRNGDNQSFDHEVYLVHAGNDNQDHSTACFNLTFNNEFSETTTPNSNFYNGDPSGLRVWDIGNESTIIEYKLGTGAPGPSLHLAYNSLSGDDNANGFLEPGESANVDLTSTNNGQLSSAVATLSCVAIGANASLVTVNTNPINVGVINVSQLINSTFNITVDPTLTAGQSITLRFTLSDGTDSTYITKTILIGVIDLMNDVDLTTCSAVFLDQGGASNYSDNTDFTKTIAPLTSGQFITADFQSFDVEDEINCGYDYLQIHNGPTAFTTLIGTYCGTNSPGAVTSTHSTGTLTFEFHSDGGATAAGWLAMITCSGPTGINSANQLNTVEIYPNPSKGLFNIRLNSNEKVTVTVTDMLGKIIATRVNTNQSNFALDLSEYSNGTYFLKFQSDLGTRTERIVVSSN